LWERGGKKHTLDSQDGHIPRTAAHKFPHEADQSMSRYTRITVIRLQSKGLLLGLALGLVLGLVRASVGIILRITLGQYLDIHIYTTNG
jgi:hypothetical protein